MGCSNSKSIRLEEEAVRQAEHTLKFTYIQVNTLESALRKYSTHGKISPNQLHKLGRVLRLPVEDIGPSQKTSLFFHALATEDGLYDMHALLVIGTLLGFGSPQEKAKILFEELDREATGFISSSQWKDLISTCLIHASATLPGYAEAISFPTSELLRNYSQQLRKAVPECSAKLLDLFPDEEISVDTFIDVLCAYKGGELLKVEGWRQILQEE